jgi:hypothetical protein
LCLVYVAHVELFQGIANVVGDALSMGLGEWIGERSEIEFTRAEFKREKWEMDNHPEGKFDPWYAVYRLPLTVLCHRGDERDDPDLSKARLH